MSFACYVFSIGKNVSYISLGTGPFALGTPPFTGGADSVEKPLYIYNLSSNFLQSMAMFGNSHISLNYVSFTVLMHNVLKEALPKCPTDFGKI